ncbi:transcription factor TFIIIB subunit BDP1 [Apiospora marii]|uniref:Transcription factor TFIIIB subunit BDP1 n=1 Tax=Apiospora marii TaxID=335849 RepID=A0ABR1S3X4_9PEZI
MSSMLKKKGGKLAFKPKAKPPRNAEPASTPASQTPATTEPSSQSQSQASTPAPPSATATAPTASTPSASSNENATPTVQAPKGKEKGTVPDSTATAASSTTITKPQEPTTALPAPTPEPANLHPPAAPETTARPPPTPSDQPIEPRDTPPEKSSASIDPKPAAPDASAKQQGGHVQSAVPTPTPSQPAVTPAVTSRAGLLATPAPDGLVTPAATQPQSTPDHRPGLATPAPDGLMTPAATQSQDTTNHAASSIVAEAAPSSQQVPAPRRNLPSPPTLPIAETIAASAAPAEGQPTEAGPSTAEPKKKRQYRKRKAPAAEGEENGEAADAAPKPKRQRKKKAVPEEGAENEDGPPAAPKPRRQRKNNAAPVENGEAAAAPAEDGVQAGAAAPKSFRRRRREPTPEDAENQEIDHTTTKMADITRDLGIGKKFKHADAILERQREARRNAQMRRLERKQRAKASGNGADGTPAPEAELPAAMDDGGGVEYDIIDGQIVVNQNSLTVNQHAGQDFTSLETVEEDEFTNLTTSASYLRPSKALGTNHWSDEDTERFYHYLKMFGTDFETISHVFPGKSRRHIKLKFNREEKARPKRINAAIMARGAKKVAIDLEDFKSQWRGEGAEYEEHLEELRQQRRELGLLDDEPAAAAAAEGGDGEGQQDAAEGEEGAVGDGTQEDGGVDEAVVPAGVGVPVAAEA